MRKSQAGFTLVELLVVIAIIGVLVALLLPAVQAARESARRSQCTNNLKQLGLGMQNYHDTRKELPIGNTSCCWGTWQMRILPFIEQQQLGALYSFLPKTATTFDYAYSYAANTPTGTPAVNNRTVTQARIETLTCPSDQPQTFAAQNFTIHNYAANYGNTNHIGRDHSVAGNANYVKFQKGAFVGDDWVTQPLTAVKFKEITDGLSNTLLASEVVQGREGDGRGFTWWGWSAGFETRGVPNTTDADTIQAASECKPLFDNPPCTAPSSAASYMWAASRSRHPGGVVAGLCDASVQYVSDGVDLAVWRAASSIAGDEVAGSLGM